MLRLYWRSHDGSAFRVWTESAPGDLFAVLTTEEMVTFREACATIYRLGHIPVLLREAPDDDDDE